MTDPSLLVRQLQALANPVRLWLVARLHSEGAHYVSELARAAGISRPLLKMHLKKLEEAGLVTSEIGTADNGKSANFFRAKPFDLNLTPETIARTHPAPAGSISGNNGDNNVGR
ncbi:MAG: ArsR/SmtB family transcription factor [Hyphomicrobiales bacterium]